MFAPLIAVVVSMLAGQEDGGPPRPKPWALETLVQRCDRIVEASVSAIEELEVTNWDRTKKTIRLIDLEIREVLWGEPTLEKLTLVAGSMLDYVHGSFVKGEVDLWFLERSRFTDEAVQAKRPIDRLDPVGLQVIACFGLGRLPVVREGAETRVLLRTDRLALPTGFIASPMELPAGTEGTWVRAERIRFVEWVKRTLASCVPSVDVQWYSSSDWRREISLGPDGHCTFNDDGKVKEERLPPRALANVIAAAEGEHFFGLPGIVGKPLGPESGAVLIRIRTSSGSRLVQIHGPCDPASAGHATDDTCDRANRVLHSVPHAETWVVTGH